MFSIISDFVTHKTCGNSYFHTIIVHCDKIFVEVVKMSECSHNCGSCGQDCSSRVEINPTDDTNIKKIIGVLSGKGGVGKSMVSSLLAVELARKGYRVGIMDADITGPSIPNMFNLHGQLMGDEKGIYPLETSLGIKVISINNMLENEEDPVLWRGPMLGGLIRQFYTEVHWGDLDFLLIDMPPGTSDVAISIIQQIPVDEFVMVTTPSKLVSMIVSKAINMTKEVSKPIVGLIENMAYIKCDNCNHEIKLYKNDETENTARRYGLEVLAKIPMDSELAYDADEGNIESYSNNLMDELINKIK